MKGKGETNLDGGNQAEIGGEPDHWLPCVGLNALCRNVLGRFEYPQPPRERDHTRRPDCRRRGGGRSYRRGDVEPQGDAFGVFLYYIRNLFWKTRSFFKPLRQIPIAVTPRSSGSLTISSVQYRFLSLLPITEPLSIPGRRLNDTPAQRRDIVYTPDTFLMINVRSGGCRLDVDFLDDDADDLVDLVHGEIKGVTLRARNAGSAPIEEVWMIGGEEVCIWIDENGGTKVVYASQRILTTGLRRNAVED